MKFNLPPQFANISPFASFLLPVTSGEERACITHKVRVLRIKREAEALSIGGELTILMKKVPGQRASLLVTSVDDKPFTGLAKNGGKRHPDMMARGCAILQAIANAQPRRHTIALERYCDLDLLAQQHDLLERETLTMMSIGASSEGQAVIRKMGAVTDIQGVGFLLRKEGVLLSEKSISPPASALPQPVVSAGSVAATSRTSPKEEFWPPFRENLKIALAATALKQTVIDKTVGLYNGHISHLKNGSSRKLPTDGQLVHLAKILNVFPSDLHPDLADLDDQMLLEERANPITEGPVEESFDKELDASPVPETNVASFERPSPAPDHLPLTSWRVATPTIEVEPKSEPKSEPGSDLSVSSLNSLQMFGTNRPGRVKITLEADVDYRLARHISDLLNGAGAPPSLHLR